MSYLRRTSTSINSIDYVNTLASTDNILSRTGTSRNDIEWDNPPSSIPSGLNATPSQVLSGYKFVGSAGSLQTGTIPTQGGSTITPGTSNKTAVSAGRYVSGNIIVAGSGNLTAGNIKKGVNIFGVTGTAKVLMAKSGSGTSSNIGSTRYTLYDANGTSGRFYQLTIGNLGFTPVFFVVFGNDDMTYCPYNANGLNGDFNCLGLYMGWFPTGNQGNNKSNFSFSGSNLVVPFGRRSDFWWSAVGF